MEKSLLLNNKESYNKFNTVRAQTRSSANIFNVFQNMPTKNLVEHMKTEPNLADINNMVETNRGSHSSQKKGLTSKSSANSLGATNNSHNATELCDKFEMFEQVARFKSPKAYFKIVYSASKIW